MKEPLIDDQGDYYIDLGEGLAAMREAGLLWWLNTVALHPYGYEARVDDRGHVRLYGDGQRLIQWAPELIEDTPAEPGRPAYEGKVGAAEQMRRTAQQTLKDAAKFNNPGHWTADVRVRVAERGKPPPKVT